MDLNKFWGPALIGAIILGAVLMFTGTWNPLEKDGVGVNPSTPSTGGVNVYTPATVTLTIQGFDYYDKGTAVTTGYVMSKQGGSYGTNTLQTTTASASQKDTVDLLLNASTYHSKKVPTIQLGSDKTAVTVDSSYYNGLVKNSSLTLSVYADSGIAVLTNGGGATNETPVAGKTYNHKIKAVGTSKASTQDMMVIFEFTNKSNIVDYTLSGFGAQTGVAKLSNGDSYTISVPISYTQQASNSFQKVYVISPIENGASVEGNLQVQSGSGLGLNGATGYSTWKTFEYFLGADGKIHYDVEDKSASPAVNKAMASYTTSWVYQP